MTKLSLSFSVSAALVSLTAFVASVGCSAPETGSIDKGDSNLTDKPPTKKVVKEPPSETKNPTPAAGTAGTAAPASTAGGEKPPPSKTRTPPPSSSMSGSGTSSSGAPGGDPDQCFASCAAKDPKAAKLDECTMSCQDEQCDSRCLQQAGCTDPEQCPAGEILDECAQTCGLDDQGGGEQGPGGPGGSEDQNPFVGDNF